MITLLAHAKINLYLEIIGDRPDGFHELVMVMQSVGLADQITLRPMNASVIQINCDHPLVPADHTNLAYRAAALLQKRFPNRTNRCGGVEITIDKKIPVGAGLAGGSANAAAALFGLDVLWQLGLTRIELQELGAELGSDVPFCLAGGCAIATGRGEDVDSLSNTPKLTAVLAKYSTLSVSTPWAYKTYRQQFKHTYRPVGRSLSQQARLAAPPASPSATTPNMIMPPQTQYAKSGGMMKALSAHDCSAIGSHLRNDLEKVVLPVHPKVAQLRAVMADQGGLGTLISGSGPTVFTLAETPQQAEEILSAVRAQIADADLQLQVAPFVAQGIRLIGQAP
ncbi:MAG: 4-(cytidine 5'-diphospho)-2-C-methyl-D-erythritol kinase [Phormidesmis sp.]